MQFKSIFIIVILLSLMGLLCFADCVSAQGIVAEYRFETVTDNQTPDTSGKGNDAIVFGARPIRAGNEKGLLFNGIDSYVDCGSRSNLDLRQTVSVECLVRPDGVPSQEVGIAGKGADSYALTYYSDGYLYWYINGGGNGIRARLTSDIWHYVVGTYDGKTSRLYIDGSEVASKEIVAPIKEAANFYIGLKAPKTGFFKGGIASVRIYNCAVPAAEVTSNYNGLANAMLPRVDTITDGQTLKGKGFNVLVGKTGAVEVNVSSDRYNLETHLSYPADSTGWNDLGTPGASCETTWNPQMTRAGEGVNVLAAGTHYKLKRNVRVSGHRVFLSDTLTNTSKEDLAIIYRNDLVTPVPFKQRLIAGANVAAEGRAENPSAFVSQANSGLALLAEDTVLRLQHGYTSSPNGVRMSDDHFALKPGKSYTFRWTIYPLQAKDDYWSFVNQVRLDWDVNARILGPWVAMYLANDSDMALIRDPVALKKFLKLTKPEIVSFSPWVDYENFSRSLGKPVDREMLKARAKEATAAIKKIDPKILCIGCLETGNVSPPEEVRKAIVATMPGAPQNIYNFTPDQFAVLEKYNVPWRDSLLMSADGHYKFEHYLRGPVENRFPMIAVLVIPEIGNGYHKYLMGQAKFLLEDVGLDGIYIDQFNMAFNSTNRYSYDKWDGATVDIDRQTGRIARKYTDAGLVSIPARKQLVQYVLKKGQYMLANGFPTNPDMQSLRMHRFNESEWVFDPFSWADGAEPPLEQRPCEAHFSTPISLGVRPDRFGEAGTKNYTKVIMKTVIAYLRHGLLYYHYDIKIPEDGSDVGGFEAISHMFPITPARLFEGGMAGKERTVTAVSGKYEWVNERKPQVLVFGLDGLSTKPVNLDVQRTKDGWTVNLGIKDWENIAVIE